PLVLSAALVSATARRPTWREMKRMAASGYRDVSRLASGDPTMARDICLTNRENLVRWIDDYIEELHRYREVIQGDPEEIHRVFAQSQEARDRWVAGGSSDDSPSPFDELPTWSERMTSLVAGEKLARLGRRLE